MRRRDGDNRPTKFYRVTKTTVQYVYLLASDEAEVLDQVAEGYGIPVELPTHNIEDITEAEWYAGIAGVEDENGGWFNSDGTAMFYNDEYHELYRLDPERRMWLPVDDDPREDFSDGETYMLSDENDEDPLDPFEL